MKSQFYFLFCLLSLIFSRVSAQSQYVEVNLVVSNRSSGGDGSTAVAGQTLTYRVTIKNLSPTLPVTGIKVAADIPPGTYYNPGSTSITYFIPSAPGTSVGDVNGKMPFQWPTGGTIASLAPGATIWVNYEVVIVANAGNLTNHATFQGVRGNDNIFVSPASPVTRLILYPYTTGLYGIYHGSYQQNPETATYPYIRGANLSTGAYQAGGFYYSGPSGLCQDVDGTALAAGSLLTDGRGLAYDSRTRRLYFTNKTLNQNLSYVDLAASTPVANVFGNISYPLQTGAVSDDEVINRMAFAVDYKGYALSSNGQNLTRFDLSATGTGTPNINPLGPLVNDPLNGANDVLAEREGDIFGDGNGRLFLITGLAKLYKIIPDTRVATYLGTISGLPNNFTVTAVAEAAADESTNAIYLAGYNQKGTTSFIAYSTFSLNLGTMSATLLANAALTTITATTDFAGDVFMPHGHFISATQYGEQIDDRIDYTIEVTNQGDIPAAGVKVYNPIPGFTDYIPGSTSINGIAVADLNGGMPFATAGGTLIPGADLPGLLKGGDANKAVIKFSVQPQLLGITICNTALIRYYDMDNKLLSLVAAPKAKDQLAEPVCITSTSGARKANIDTAQVPAKSSVKVRPNPFADNLYVQVTLSKNENVLIRLTDLQGRTVYTSKQTLSTGVNNLNIAVKNDLPHGIYIIEVLAGNKRLLQQKLEKL